jgi:hypothetical protein
MPASAEAVGVLMSGCGLVIQWHRLVSRVGSCRVEAGDRRRPSVGGEPVTVRERGQFTRPPHSQLEGRYLNSTGSKASV